MLLASRFRIYRVVQGMPVSWQDDDVVLDLLAVLGDAYPGEPHDRHSGAAVKFGGFLGRGHPPGDLVVICGWHEAEVF